MSDGIRTKDYLGDPYQSQQAFQADRVMAEQHGWQVVKEQRGHGVLHVTYSNPAAAWSELGARDVRRRLSWLDMAVALLLGALVGGGIVYVWSETRVTDALSHRPVNAIECMTAHLRYPAETYPQCDIYQ